MGREGLNRLYTDLMENNPKNRKYTPDLVLVWAGHGWRDVFYVFYDPYTNQYYRSLFQSDKKLRHQELVLQRSRENVTTSISIFMTLNNLHVDPFRGYLTAIEKADGYGKGSKDNKFVDWWAKRRKASEV